MYTFEPLIAVTSVLDYFIAYALRVAEKLFTLYAGL
jgi:hypothetical protein